MPSNIIPKDEPAERLDDNDDDDDSFDFDLENFVQNPGQAKANNEEEENVFQEEAQCGTPPVENPVDEKTDTDSYSLHKQTTQASK